MYVCSSVAGLKKTSFAIFCAVYTNHLYNIDCIKMRIESKKVKAKLKWQNNQANCMYRNRILARLEVGLSKKAII